MRRAIVTAALTFFTVGCGSTEPDSRDVIPVGQYDYHFQVGNSVLGGRMTVSGSAPDSISGVLDVFGTIETEANGLRWRYEPATFVGRWRPAEDDGLYPGAVAGFHLQMDENFYSRTPGTSTFRLIDTSYHVLRVWQEGSVTNCWALQYDFDGSLRIQYLPATCSLVRR